MKEIITLRTDEYVDKKGHIRRRAGKVPDCDCCGKPALVLMEIGRYKDDWLIQQCDTCLELVCSECCDVTDNGEVVCIDCLQDPNRPLRRSHDPSYERPN
jgi:hypothetical protein